MLNGLRISVLRGYPCFGGRRDMEVGVSILYPARPPVSESVFPEGRGIDVWQSAGVLYPVKPPPFTTCESPVYLEPFGP